MSWIKDLFKFFKDDIKKDVQTVKEIVDRIDKKQPIIPKEKMDEIKKLKFIDIVKANWLMWLMLMLAFTVGWMLTAKYYEVLAHNLVLEEVGKCLDKYKGTMYDNITNYLNFT